MLSKARQVTLALALIFAGVSMAACYRSRWVQDANAVFFPLRPHMLWMYRVQSKSQQQTYTVTDMVVGSEFVPALNVTGEVVQEFYNFDRAGLRPIVYTEKGGYLTRLSGLDYVQNQIKGPVWGRSIEEDFLPERLAPDETWNNKLFPYGKLPGAFQVVQSHRSFVESEEVVVPAGHFSGCIRIDTDATYVGGPYKRDKPALKLGYKDWYAPNVGLIKTIAYQGGADGPPMELVELIRFSAGGAGSSSQRPEPPRKGS